MSVAALPESFSLLLDRYASGVKWLELEPDSPQAFQVARVMHAAIIKDANEAWRKERASTYEKRVEEEVMKRTLLTAPQGLSPAVWTNTAAKLLGMAKREVNRQDETAYQEHVLELESDELMAELTSNVMAKIALVKGRHYQMRGSLRSSFRGSLGPRSSLLFATDRIRRGNSTDKRTKQLAMEVTDRSKGTRNLQHDRVRAIAFKDDIELGRKRRDADSYSDLESRSACSSRAATGLSLLGGRETSSTRALTHLEMSQATFAFKQYMSKKNKGGLTELCELALNFVLEVDSPQSSVIIDSLAASEISGQFTLTGLNLNAKSSFVLHKILPLCRHLSEIHISRSAISKEYAALIIPMASVLPLSSLSIVEADIKSESLALILAALARPTETSAAIHPRITALSRPPRSSSPGGDGPSPVPPSPVSMQSTAPSKPYMTGMAPNWWLTLKYFDLSHNASVGDEGFSKLVPCLCKLKNLKGLKLAGIGITDNSASTIKHLLITSEIESLDLSSNAGLQKNTALAIASALSDAGVSRRLTHLDLNLNEGLHASISIITWSYISWNSLESLGFAGVRMNEDDKMAVACMLRFSGSKVTLKSLDISRAGDLTTVSGQVLLREIRARREGSHMKIETEGCKLESINVIPRERSYDLDLGDPHSRLIVKMLAEHEVLGKRNFRFSSWTSLRIDGGPDLIPSVTWKGVEHEGWLGNGLPRRGKLALTVLPLPLDEAGLDRES